MNKMFKNKTILITGGTGSFGSTFIKKLLKIDIRLRKSGFLVGMKKNSMT